VRRRDLIAALSACALWPFAAAAQTPARPTIGVLITGTREPFSTMFQEELRALRYVDGDNVRLDVQSAPEGEQLGALAAGLVERNVDLIVTFQTPAAAAAKHATGNIPIVMASAGDPVGTGLVTSLARPGGNITGVSTATAELAGKTLELLREIVPGARRFAVLLNATDPFTGAFLNQVQLTSRSLGIEAVPFTIHTTQDVEVSFTRIAAEAIGAVLVQPSLPATSIIASAVKHRVIVAAPNALFAHRGGLLSYAGNGRDNTRQAAVYVDRILKGSKPADLPVVQPIKFDLVINLKTANAIGAKIPPSLLATADEVIE
jgi:putative ABC transport system substrate-binding protein